MKYGYAWWKDSNEGRKKEFTTNMHVGTVWFHTERAAVEACEFYWSMLKHAPSITRMAVIDKDHNILKEYKCQ